MICFKNTLDFYIEEPCVISLGKFDGLHLGHRYLMEEMERSHDEGLSKVLFTFDIPPKSIHAEGFRVLSTNDEKQRIFEQSGVDYLIECPFTDELRQMAPYDFLKLLNDRINIKKIVTGDDFCFGYQRSGNYRTLQQHADEFGYEIAVVKKKQYQGQDISSSRIRDAVEAGDMELARILLGYPYFVSGIVEHGNAIGRTIGFPTTNLVPPTEKLLPPFGVYASRVYLRDEVFAGISNVGCKPTIDGNNPAGVETFIFDFNRDIYDHEIKVEFLEFIRPERKFNGLDELVEQMNKDKDRAKIILYK